MGNRLAFSLSRKPEACLPNMLHSTADGRQCPIDPDFRTVLACLRRLADPNRDELAKRLYLAARFFLCEPPSDYIALFSDFVMASEAPTPAGEPLLDFEQDAGAIYASFRQQYGLDLLRTPLHWVEFRELLAGLNEQTAFGARVRLRALDENNVAPEDRPAIRRLKEQVTVRPRVGREEQALLAELDRRLAAGESPGDVLAKLKNREE
jgi:hypothetical protein